MKQTQSLTGRRVIMKMMFASVLGAMIHPPAKAFAALRQWWTPTPAMDAMTAIRTRRSVRAYTDKDVSDAQVKELLGAAMSAPSAGNEQPWEFVVIRDTDTLAKVGGLNRFAGYAKNAPVCILVCGNLDHDKYGGYWFEDVSAATQNILLAAHAMGLGAVWTGIYPMEDRILGFRKLVGAPENIVPLALVVIGHPKNSPKPIDRFTEKKVHQERWSA
jgi:nitroreductase